MKGSLLNSALQTASNRWGVAPQRLRPPALRTDGITRAGLLHALVSADAPVVVIDAGAGYGKTTLLRQWVDADLRPIAWFALLFNKLQRPMVFLRHTRVQPCDKSSGHVAGRGVARSDHPGLEPSCACRRSTLPSTPVTSRSPRRRRRASPLQRRVDEDTPAVARHGATSGRRSSWRDVDPELPLASAPRGRPAGAQADSLAFTDASARGHSSGVPDLARHHR